MLCIKSAQLKILIFFSYNATFCLFARDNPSLIDSANIQHCAQSDLMCLINKGLQWSLFTTMSAEMQAVGLDKGRGGGYTNRNTCTV